MRRFCSPILVTAVFCLLSAGCKKEPDRARVIGECFIGQNGLPIREEIATTSRAVAEGRFGEQVEILDRRRRFFKIRTASNKEGWVDGRNLLSTPQMNDINRLTTVGAKLPAQGKAMVYESLNLHTEPNRSAPSLAQIPASGTVEVIGHRLVPHVPFRPPQLIPEVTRTTPRKDTKKKKAILRAQPIPMPTGPPPPPNWQALSRPRMEKEPSADAAEKPKPIPLDDWNLVRTSDGKVGWALTRMLAMSIPDRVARYAEGQRISSYFPLGDPVEYEGDKYFNYLWTTQKHTLEPYEFDGFRVFIFNAKRHRYETAYMDKQVKGFYPVSLSTTQITENRKVLTVPAFTVIVEEDDGKLYKRTYSFQLYRVRLVDRQPWNHPPEPLQSAAGSGKLADIPVEPRSISTEIHNTVRDKMKKLLGK